MSQSMPERKYDILLRQVGDLPSLPDIIYRIVEILGQPDTPASEVARLISFDPGLTTKFLRIVNSAAYGFQRQVSSVQHAIMILGFTMVRGVVLSASIFKMFENRGQHGLDPADFWRHSIETGIGSRIIAANLKIPYEEDAFSAGMLHDVGKMILNCYYRQDYQEVLSRAKLSHIPTHGTNFYQVEQQTMELNHAELGYHVGLKWKLPVTFYEVMRYHHTPQLSKDATELVYAVALANSFSHLIRLNFSVFNMDFIPPAIQEYYAQKYELPDDFFEDLFRQVCEEMDGVDDLLISLKK